MKQKSYSQFIAEIYTTALRRHWKRHYDKDSDALFWTKRPYPANDRLAKVAKEITFYLGKGGVVNGIIIQPFISNFVSHTDKEVAGILKVLTEENDRVSSAELKKAEAFLSTSIKADIYEDIAEEEYSIKDLNKFLVSVAR